MTVAELGQILRRRFRPFLAVVLAVVLLGGVLLVLVPASQRARTTFFVLDRPTATGAAVTSNGTLLSQERVKSYSAVLTGDRIADDVSRLLGGQRTPDEVRKALTVDSEPDTVVITVTAADHDPAVATAMAGAVGRSFSTFVDRLERPTPTSPPVVSIQTVKQPEIVTVAAWQRPATYLAVALVAGLVLGGAVAVVLDRRDRTVRSSAGLEAITGVVPIADIPDGEQETLARLVRGGDPGHVMGEAYRRARTNLMFAAFERRSRVLMITSGMPHEGKSTVTCGLAAVLAKGGSRVLVVDSDLRRPTVATTLGIPAEVGLTNVLAGQVEIGGAVQHHLSGGYDVMAAGTVPPNPSEMVGSDRMANLLADVGSHYDVVLVDTPPVLLVTDAVALAPMVDGIVVCVRHGRSTTAEIGRTTEALSAVRARMLGTVLVGVPGDRGGRKYDSYYGSDPATARSTNGTPPAVSSPNGAASAKTPVNGFPRNGAAQNGRARHSGAHRVTTVQMRNGAARPGA